MHCNGGKAHLLPSSYLWLDVEQWKIFPLTEYVIRLDQRLTLVYKNRTPHHIYDVF
jgi:hypothetical protein